MCGIVGKDKIVSLVLGGTTDQMLELITQLLGGDSRRDRDNEQIKTRVVHTNSWHFEVV